MELNELKNHYKIPNHIGVIIDGNGRWAKERNLPRKEGHVKGFENLKNLYEIVKEAGVKYVSVYAFSTDNWNRPKEEVDGLMKLFKKGIKEFKDEKKYHNTRICFSGDMSRFEKSIQKDAIEIMENSKNNDGFHINLCLNYGGREEIVMAVNKLIAQGKTEITAEDITNSLYSSYYPNLDFVIRTSGEQRLSNFMSWQSIYAELYFPKVLWPDFSKDDFIEAIKEYSRRDRRFGRIEE